MLLFLWGFCVKFLAKIMAEITSIQKSNIIADAVSVIKKEEPSSKSPASKPSTREKVKKAVFYTFAAIASAAVVGVVVAFVVAEGLSQRRQRNAFQEGKDLKQEIDRLRASGDSNWQEKALVLIRLARKDNPAEELSRLRGAGVLDSRTEKKLEYAQEKVIIEPLTPFSVYYHGRPHVKKLYGQALEIKKLYQDTFDVFIHAQASPWLPINYLVKELWRTRRPQDNLHQFKPLRAPCSTASPGFTEATYRVVNTINPLGAKGIEKYKDRWFQLFTLSDSDPKVREELLSVDAFFYNNSRFESALHFLTNNANILDDPKKIEDIAEKTIRHFEPSIPEAKLRRLANKVTKTIKPANHPCGNLFVFCVPKEESQKVQYRAHPFGLACDCHPKEEERAILDKLQNGVFDTSTKCTSFIFKTTTPQYRLYLPEVQPETEKVFLLTSLTSEKRHEMKESIRDIVMQTKPQRSFLS